MRPQRSDRGSGWAGVERYADGIVESSDFFLSSFAGPSSPHPLAPSPCFPPLASLHAPRRVRNRMWPISRRRIAGRSRFWWGKLETYFETHSLDDVRRLLGESGMAAPVASYQGGLLISQGDARREHWDHFRRRLAIARRLAIGTLVVAGDVEGPLAQEDFERLRVSLRQAADEAGEAGVRLALEFQARAALPNNLQSAAALVADCNSPNLGICLDLFHYTTGPSKPEDLVIYRQRICSMCSSAIWPDRARTGHRRRPHPARRRRILARTPGRPLARNQLRRRGLVELMNPQLWAVPPRQFGEVAITALRECSDWRAWIDC